MGRDVHRPSASSFVLPDGRVLDAGRPRSLGVLDPVEIAFCRAHGIALGFDPTQNGFVTLDCEDDLVFAPTPFLDIIEPSAKQQRPEPSSLAARFTFRPWELDDRSFFLDLIRDPEVWRYLPEPYPEHLDEETARNLIAISNEIGRHHVRAVILDGSPIGQVRLLFERGDPGATRAEISYWFGRQHWGRRIGSEVVATFTRQSFAAFPHLAAIIARVHRENQASARVLVKSGYQPTGDVAPGSPWVQFVRERSSSRSGGQIAA